MTEADQLRSDLDEQCRIIGMSGERELSYLAQIGTMQREITRLRNIAQSAHDRLLRGDSDAELCALLATAWSEQA